MIQYLMTEKMPPKRGRHDIELIYRLLGRIPWPCPCGPHVADSPSAFIGRNYPLPTVFLLESPPTRLARLHLIKLSGQLFDRSTTISFVRCSCNQ